MAASVAAGGAERSGAVGVTHPVIETASNAAGNNGASYLLCGNNTGGSGKWYVYDSANGGSVKASTATTLNLTTCT